MYMRTSFVAKLFYIPNAKKLLYIRLVHLYMVNWRRIILLLLVTSTPTVSGIQSVVHFPFLSTYIQFDAKKKYIYIHGGIMHMCVKFHGEIR